MISGKAYLFKHIPLVEIELLWIGHLTFGQADIWTSWKKLSFMLGQPIGESWLSVELWFGWMTVDQSAFILNEQFLNYNKLSYVLQALVYWPLIMVCLIQEPEITLKTTTVSRPNGVVPFGIVRSIFFHQKVTEPLGISSWPSVATTPLEPRTDFRTTIDTLSALS